MAASSLQIRSFRVCFRLERRIHKIDRWRIPLPFGVPLRGVGYALLAFAAIAFAARLPLLGTLLGGLPAPLRLVILPVGVAYAVTRWEIDGRPAHASALAWMRMRLAPARIAAWRPAPAPGPVALGNVTIAGDGQGARLRSGVVVGPAQLIVRYPVRPRQRGRTLLLVRQPGGPRWRGTRVTLRRGQRAVLR
jgi:hypothetical protein